jgi:hypothetical protein
VRRLIETAERMMKEHPSRQVDDEAVMSWVLDESYGGWIGCDAFLDNHMPPYFMGRFCPPWYQHDKSDVFRHHNFKVHRIGRLRRRGKWPLRYPFVGQRPS